MNPENIIQELKKLIEKHEAKDPYTEPWTLGRELPGFRALRDGEEWSRQDFSKEMLDGGWRPCLKGENMQPGDESGECYEKPEGSGPKRWVSVKGLLQTSAHMRTKRPLPILSASQIAEGWKEHTGGENPAPGKRCQVILHSGTVTKVEPSQIWGWAKTGQPWGIAAYRIIEPRLVPLGPEDVPILSVLRHIRNPSYEYAITSKVAGELKSYVMGWTYSTLMGNMEINRSTPITGKWDASAWEPCHKEAAQ